MQEFNKDYLTAMHLTLGSEDYKNLFNYMYSVFKKHGYNRTIPALVLADIIKDFKNKLPNDIKQQRVYSKNIFDTYYRIKDYIKIYRSEHNPYAYQIINAKPNPKILQLLITMEKTGKGPNFQNATLDDYMKMMMPGFGGIYADDPKNENERNFYIYYSNFIKPNKPSGIFYNNNLSSGDIERYTPIENINVSEFLKTKKTQDFENDIPFNKVGGDKYIMQERQQTENKLDNMILSDSKMETIKKLLNTNDINAKRDIINKFNDDLRAQRNHYAAHDVNIDEYIISPKDFGFVKKTIRRDITDPYEIINISNKKILTKTDNEPLYIKNDNKKILTKTDNEPLYINNNEMTQINPIHKKKPIYTILSEEETPREEETPNEEETPREEETPNEEEEKRKHSSYSDSSIDVDSELDKVDINDAETLSEEEQAKEEEERKILKREEEKKAQEYAEKSLKQMINGDNLLEGMQTFMKSVRDLPENIYDKNFENYAIVLSNTTINGEKIFNDVEEAKQFINKIRNGANTSKRYIKPRAYKQIKQEIQKQSQLTPMISRNVKNRTNAINVYQY